MRMFVHSSGFFCSVILVWQDELARVLVTLFDSRHLLYQLLWNMFSKEVELADSMQTLFRGNSLASKIMTFCFKVDPQSSSWADLSRRLCCRGAAVTSSALFCRCMGQHTCRSCWSLYWEVSSPPPNTSALRWIPPGEHLHQLWSSYRQEPAKYTTGWYQSRTLGYIERFSVQSQ